MNKIGRLSYLWQMKYIFPFLLLFFSKISPAQINFQPARAAGMGQASVAYRDVNSLLSNQAGLAWLEDLSVLATAERRFALSELNSVAAGVALPVGLGTFGFVAGSFGFEDFRQQKLGLAYARRLMDNFSVGAQFDYIQTRIPEYGSRGVITFEAGMQGKLSKEITVGIHVFSPAKVEFAEGEYLPAIFRLGFAWLLSDKALFAAELEKDVDFKARVKGGFEYRIAQPVYLRTGFGNNPSTFHLGIGFLLNGNLTIATASAFHKNLVFPPAAGVGWTRG